MMNSINPDAPFLKSFKQDFLASIVIFLVALPLCMGPFLSRWR